MKTPNYFLKTCILLGLILGSCSKDSGGDGNNDIALSLDEYPSAGTIVATMESNLGGTVQYAITFQSAQGAFALNNSSGTVTIDDPLVFDFETNPIVTGTITASNGTDLESIEVAITVNDIDDIEYVLSDSKADYQSATENEWVEVTKQEYDSLFTVLNEISFVGTSESHFNESLEDLKYFEYHSNSTLANEGVPMLKEEYLFAFTYISGATEANQTKLKVSPTGLSSGYEDFGSVLPLHGADQVYFVLKGNSTTYPTDSYLAVYCGTSIGWNPFYNSNGVQHLIRSGDTNTIADFNNATVVTTVCIYHGLSTPIKQWN